MSILGNTIVFGRKGGGVAPKDVNFIDYDGTVLFSYTAQEAQALSALPSSPSRPGLTAQGWNWTLQQIKAQLTAAPDGPVWVGQMYVTQSGDTEIDVTMRTGRLNPVLFIGVNGTVTVDWGDGTSPDTVTRANPSSLTSIPHSYAAAGDYMIKIHVVTGTFRFHGQGSRPFFRKNTNMAENHDAYSNCVKAVRFGNGVDGINYFAFVDCYNLTTITLPSGVNDIGWGAFCNCSSLTSITIPSGCQTIGNDTLEGCSMLKSIALPSSVESIGEFAFQHCSALRSITIPNGVTQIGTTAFAYCSVLQSVMIPSGVTSLANSIFYDCYALQSITLLGNVVSVGNNLLRNCHSLTSITLPSSVTQIGTYAFADCEAAAEYHFKSTTPPTIASSGNSFQNMPGDCVIYVPAASLETYKTATGWSYFANNMQGE